MSADHARGVTEAVGSENIPNCFLRRSIRWLFRGSGLTLGGTEHSTGLARKPQGPFRTTDELRERAHWFNEADGANGTRLGLPSHYHIIHDQSGNETVGGKRSQSELRQSNSSPSSTLLCEYPPISLESCDQDANRVSNRSNYGMSEHDLDGFAPDLRSPLQQCEGTLRETPRPVRRRKKFDLWPLMRPILVRCAGLQI